MKKLFTLALALYAAGAFAVDRVVEEFGIAPAYASIGAAVAAAQNGDRILVKNRAGDIPWIENITIDKSLEFHSHTNNVFFIVQGTYTIARIEGLTVSIVGMRNTSGGINIGGAGTPPARSVKVNVMDSQFVIGDLTLNNNAYDVQVVGNTFMNGRIAINFGNIIGNDITFVGTGSHLVDVTNTVVAFQNDTCLIVGNKVNQTSTSVASYYAINVSNQSQVVHVRNNYVQFRVRGINTANGINQPINNIIWNNTLHGGNSGGLNTSTITYGIHLGSVPANCIWEVMGNVLIRGNLSAQPRAIGTSSVNGQINVYYNHISTNWVSGIVGTFTFVDLNQTNQTITLNLADGTFSNTPNAIDGGNPAPQFYDLDLTTNDAGAYGGSYTLSNFHPLHVGPARVYNVIYPFNVRVGSTLNVKAFSFDR
jgi:hypothetical protein